MGITIPRVAALLAVNWFCARKDGDNRAEALRSCYRLLVTRGWPNYLRKMQGLWAGHWGRDHHHHYTHIPELFLYSNKDFYVSANYLEREVISRRRKEGSDFTAVRFQGTRHVQHYRKHKVQYEAAVRDFLMKSFGSVEDVEELEEMEEVEEKVGIIQRGRNAMEPPPSQSQLRCLREALDDRRGISMCWSMPEIFPPS